jgi:hypothetical protein
LGWRLDPPVHHLRKAGEIGDVAHLQTGIAQRLGSAAGRDQLDAVPRERQAELGEAGLVRNGQQCARNSDLGHKGSFSDARARARPAIFFKPEAGGRC